MFIFFILYFLITITIIIPNTYNLASQFKNFQLLALNFRSLTNF